MIGQADMRALLAGVSPQSVGRLLERFGFCVVDHERSEMQIYEGVNGEQLILPMDRSRRDYVDLLWGLAQALVRSDRSFQDIVCLLFSPDSAIFRYSIEDPTVGPGTIPIGYASESIAALVSFIRFTAAGCESQRRVYTDVPRRAKMLSASCRLGHTEAGSFTLKVYCPSALAPQLTEDSPFGLEVLHSCISNLRYVSRELPADDGASLPPMMNLQVASAIARLQPVSDFGTAFASVDYVRDIEPRLEESRVPLTSRAFQNAKVVSARLARVAQQEEEVFRGYITDLHKDRPREDVGDVVRRVTLDVKHGSVWRRLIVPLTETSYRRAVEWHDHNEAIFIQAVVDKQRTPWTAVDVREMRRLDVGQLRLF